MATSGTWPTTLEVGNVTFRDLEGYQTIHGRCGFVKSNKLMLLTFGNEQFLKNVNIVMTILFK